MSEPDTVCSFLIIQVMQDTQSNDNVRLLKSRTVPNCPRVTNNKCSSVAVFALGSSNIASIHVETNILNRWQPRQYLSGATTDVNDFILCLRAHMSVDKPFPQSVAADKILEIVV